MVGCLSVCLLSAGVYICMCVTYTSIPNPHNPKNQTTQNPPIPSLAHQPHHNTEPGAEDGAGEAPRAARQVHPGARGGAGGQVRPHHPVGVIYMCVRVYIIVRCIYVCVHIYRVGLLHIARTQSSVVFLNYINRPPPSSLLTPPPPTHPTNYNRNKGLEYYYAEEDAEARARAEARLAPMTGEEKGGVDPRKAIRTDRWGLLRRGDKVGGCICVRACGGSGGSGAHAIACERGRSSPPTHPPKSLQHTFTT